MHMALTESHVGVWAVVFWLLLRGLLLETAEKSHSSFLHHRITLVGKEL